MLIPRRVKDQVWGERNPETEYFIDVTPSLSISILAVEEKYHAEYVCETDCVSKDLKTFYNNPGMVFWQRGEPYPGGSNWFVLYFLRNTLYIADAKPIVDTPITGIIADNNEIIFSRYRHDMRTSRDGSVWIDGGRDYTRSGIYPKERFVTLQIEDGHMILKDSADSHK